MARSGGSAIDIFGSLVIAWVHRMAGHLPVVAIAEMTCNGQLLCVGFGALQSNAATAEDSPKDVP